MEMNSVKNDGKTEILLAMHRVEDKLQKIIDILNISNEERIKASKEKVISGSDLRKNILKLCDGTRSVRQISSELNKSIQQISNNIALLQGAGLIKEIREGKEKHYKKVK